MLQTAAVPRRLFELLKTLMADARLRDFHLVGGTALALVLGHRQSIDIDLFTPRDFDVEGLRAHLVNSHGYAVDKVSHATLIGHVNGIKVDCIRYNYPLVKPIEEMDGIRMASLADIAAMKLIAASQSGDRLKDFVDLAFLSCKLTLNQMLEAFAEKYAKTDKMVAVRGLTYFNDIDFSVKIDLPAGQFNWQNIAARLHTMVKYPDRLFPNSPITYQ